MKKNIKSSSINHEAAGYPRGRLLPLAGLAALTILMFLDVLIQPGKMLSHLGNDLSTQFIPWREFGFSQLRQGHLALWNPYIYGGMPYVGGFQSAMFYPPNLIHLLLPVAPAINVLITLHTFLTGLFMYFWASRRGLHPLAAVMSGVLLMFCGAGFMYVYAGHLPNLYSLPWVPLLFLVVDELFQQFDLRWCLLGMAALAMQILAGHPQYVFYTGVAVAVYTCLRLPKARRRTVILMGIALVFLGGAALTAVQFLTGLAASGQSVRSVGVPFEFAAMFSFPPENFLTLVAPGFFGDMIGTPYWGRWYLWEMSLFFGTTGLVLAIYGALEGEKPLRRHLLLTALILLLLALGFHTPLQELLYNFVPGFKQFRGSSKFIWQASVFLVMLAGVGLHKLILDERKHTWLAAGILGGAGAAALGGLLLRMEGGASAWWQGFTSFVFSSHESYLSPSLFSDPGFLQRMAIHASWTLFIAAGTLGILGILVLGLSRSRSLVFGIALLAVLEVFVFARYTRASFDLAQLPTPQLREFFQSHPGDYRVFNLDDPNISLATGVPDIWGDDPGVSLRYAQLMAHTQGEPPENATQYLQVHGIPRLYRMLRLRYVLKGGKITEVKEPLPRALLIHEYSVVSDRDRLFQSMDAPAFDPERTVMLESQPEPVPVMPEGEIKDTVRILEASTDHLILEAEATAPAILLITDGYDKDWCAKPLAGSIQSKYQVMPANYVLRGIPLMAGHHRLRLEYAPSAFRFGLWISCGALLAYLAAMMWVWKRQKAVSSGVPARACT